MNNRVIKSNTLTNVVRNMNLKTTNTNALNLSNVPLVNKVTSNPTIGYNNYKHLIPQNLSKNISHVNFIPAPDTPEDDEPIFETVKTYLTKDKVATNYFDDTDYDAMFDNVIDRLFPEYEYYDDILRQEDEPLPKSTTQRKKIKILDSKSGKVKTYKYRKPTPELGSKRSNNITNVTTTTDAGNGGVQSRGSSIDDTQLITTSITTNTIQESGEFEKPFSDPTPDEVNTSGEYERLSVVIVEDLLDCLIANLPIPKEEIDFTSDPKHDIIYVDNKIVNQPVACDDVLSKVREFEIVSLPTDVLRTT